MSASDIAAAAERNISGQADLLTTLSLAIIGGLLAVIVQVRTHNASPGNTPIEMDDKWLMWSSMGCAAATVALTFLVKGMLVQISPQMFSHAYDTTKAFSDQIFLNAPIGALRMLAAIQFLTFILAIVFGVFFVTRNGS